MRSYRLILFLVCLLSMACDKPLKQDYRVEIFKCQTSDLFIVNSGSLHCINPFLNLEYPGEYDFTVELDKQDLENVVDNVISYLDINKTQQVLVDKCIAGGSKYKIKFYKGDKLVNRVLIGNYYDENLNVIFEILSKYLQDQTTEITIGLGSLIDLRDEEPCLNEMTAEEIEEKLNRSCKIPSID